MSAVKFVVTLTNHPEQLGLLHRRLEQFGRAHNLPAKMMFQLNLALEELFTNIVSYGYADQAEHTIQIHLAMEKGSLIVRVEDDGVPFNPDQAQSPDLKCPLEERQIGGLGVHFIKKFMDKMVYERRNGKNILIMKRTIGDHQSRGKRPHNPRKTNGR